MTQDKKHSLLESITNTFVGLVFTLVCAPLIYWIAGIETSYLKMSGVTALFTILSVARNYVIRRWFNKIKT
jgi:membrane protein implicated in regulation of membrane protease activity